MTRPRQVSDEKIIRVARQCLLQHGPAVPTATIAKKLGVSQATLFQRFSTKQELMKAALLPGTPPPWLNVAAAGPDQRPVRAQLVELGLAIHAFFAEMTPRFEVLRSCGLMPHHKQGESMPLRSHRILTGWFERAVEAGLLAPHDSRPVALAFLGAIQVRAWFEHIGQKAMADTAVDHVETVVDLLHGALAVPPRIRRKK